MSRLRIGTVVGLWLMAGISAYLGWPPRSGVNMLAPRVHRRSHGSQAAAPGLVFRIEEDLEAPAAGDEVATVASAALSPARITSIAARLPRFAAQPADHAALALSETRPAPVGRSVMAVFPAADAPAVPTVNSAAIEVTRHAPQGEAEPGAHVSLSFSRPMVAVAAHSPVDQVGLVRLTPQLPGQWRWLGTQTLVFEPRAGRLPMATEFSVDVPDGVVAANGETLPHGLHWTFQTAPPKLESFEPHGDSVPPGALLFARFDQRIDPVRVLPTIALRSASGSVPVRLATAAEIDADPRMRARCEQADREGRQGQYLVFVARQRLPAGAKIEALIGPGTPSAEGPRTTVAVQRFGFETRGRLRVKQERCGWAWCRVGESWEISFSNPLDEASIQPDSIHVEPRLPGMKVLVEGDTITISGRATRRRHHVTLSGKLRDKFGQTLGVDEVIPFDVHHLEANLSVDTGAMTVLEPSVAPSLAVRSINCKAVRARVYAVQPQDYPAYESYVRARRRAAVEPRAPGRLLSDTQIATRAEPDTEIETHIDLAPALPQERGHLIVVIDPVEAWKQEELWERPRVQSWVQVTRLGLSAFSDRQALVAWASSLADGAALAGVELSLWPGESHARSGEDGLATLALGSTPASLLVARLPQADGPDDVAFLPSASEDSHVTWQQASAGEQLQWYVADDRGTYRPGEQVHIKGWLRQRGSGHEAGPELPEHDPGQAPALHWQLHDARDREVANGVAALNALGGFALGVSLPTDMALGEAHLQLEARAAGATQTKTHSFSVEEFRRPEFEVRVQADAGPYLVGQSTRLTARASYYTGGGVSDAPAQWRVEAVPTRFTPPGLDDYGFGVHAPPWGTADARTKPKTGRWWTSHAGDHALRVHFMSVEPPQPYWLQANVWVADRNHQQGGGSTGVIVHPAAVYVGLRGERHFVELGQALEADAIAVDLEGKLLSGRTITMRATRLEAGNAANAAPPQEHDLEPCTIASATAPVRCSFRPKLPGRYRIRATVRDASGRLNGTELERWVAAEPDVARSQAPLTLDALTLVPRRSQYSPGDSAEVLLLAPFYPAEGTLSLQAAGIVRSQRFRVDGPSQTLRLPIEEGFAPNVFAEVELVGSAGRRDAQGHSSRRPAHAQGTFSLQVSTRAHALDVQVAAREAVLSPGGSTVVDVTVRDAEQRPVAGAEVALVVADEAVLALAAHELGDPLAAFYPAREAGVSHLRLRDHLLRTELGAGRAPLASQAETAPEIIVNDAVGDDYADWSVAPEAKSKRPELDPVAARRAAAAPLITRRDFSALALFAPELRSDARGRIAVPVKLPDNLTRYRVMAVAAEGARRFGRGESMITTRLPLMVRPSAPRFLSFGDRFELPVLLQNQTARAQSVDLAVRASNAEPAVPWGRRVTVPANDRVQLLVPAAAQSPGTARFQFGATSAAFSDAAELGVPVWTPATQEAFASYGVLDRGAIAQPVVAPRDVIAQFGGLTLSTSSTALQGLTDAVLYLMQYPHEYSEQIASRLLAIASLRDVLGAFGAKELPPPAELDARIHADLERLEHLQNEDGGWSFWEPLQPSWPYLTIHVTHALARAARKGFEVAPRMLQAAHAYLNQIDDHIPADYPAPVRDNLRAHALHVRKLLGEQDMPAARALIATLELAKTDVETLGLLYAVLAGDPESSAQRSTIRAQLGNRVDETAATVHFNSSFGDAGYLTLHSERRADAIVLEAWIEDQPGSDLIPKLVAGLLAQRKAGRWTSTQENAQVLAALDTYFRKYENDTPAMVARAWLGRLFAGEQRYEGRGAQAQHIEVPMAVLQAQPAAKLTVQKEGTGRLYYRVAMQYAQSARNGEPHDAGFALDRVYEALDKPSDVQREADGSWQIRAGARVRVRVRMTTQARRYHVALVDPIPAGLEAVSRAEPPGALMAGGGVWPGWYEHQNLRDDRAEAFSSVLPEGVYEYVHVALATTPGAFTVPPAHAEEMYHPETFGRSASDSVRVQ